MVRVQVAGYVFSVDVKAPSAKGSAHVSVRVLTKSTRKGEDGKYLTEGTNFDAWGNQAEYIQKYINKGDYVDVLGEKTTSTKEGTNGQKQYYTDFTLRDIYRICKGDSSGNAAQSSKASAPAAGMTEISSEDVPF